MQTIEQLIEKEGLTCKITQVASNPNWQGENGFHYLVEISKGSKSAPFFFSTGIGWIEKRNGEPVPYNVTYSPIHGFLEEGVPERRYSSHYRIKKPTLADILDCLCMDSCALDQSFEEWCSEFGYEEDSRKAEETYQACKKNAKLLLGLLGKETFNSLVFETERLQSQ